MQRILDIHISWLNIGTRTVNSHQVMKMILTNIMKMQWNICIKHITKNLDFTQRTL